MINNLFVTLFNQDQAQILKVFGSLAILLLLIIVGIVEYKRLLKYKHDNKLNDNSPKAIAINAAITVIYYAIVNILEATYNLADDTGDILDSIDRKELADIIYDNLPKHIAGIPVDVLKSQITRKEFELLVKKLYDEIVLMYREGETSLNNYIKKIIKESPVNQQTKES